MLAFIPAFVTFQLYKDYLEMQITALIFLSKSQSLVFYEIPFSQKPPQLSNVCIRAWPENKAAIKNRCSVPFRISTWFIRVSEMHMGWSRIRLKMYFLLTAVLQIFGLLFRTPLAVFHT